MAERVKSLVPSPATGIALLALVLAATGVAVAAIPSSSGLITACYVTGGEQAQGGTPLKVIDLENGVKCSGNETQLQWSQQGPAGAVGAAGPAGAPGPAGPAGPAGAGGEDADVWYAHTGFGSPEIRGGRSDTPFIFTLPERRNYVVFVNIKVGHITGRDDSARLSCALMGPQIARGRDVEAPDPRSNLPGYSYESSRVTDTGGASWSFMVASTPPERASVEDRNVRLVCVPSGLLATSRIGFTDVEVSGIPVGDFARTGFSLSGP